MNTSLISVCSVLISHGEIQGFDSLSCPRGTPKELETRGNAGVVGKASNINLLPHGLPSMERHQFGQQLFQCDAMKRIVGLWRVHWIVIPNAAIAAVFLWQRLLIVISLDPFHG